MTADPEKKEPGFLYADDLVKNGRWEAFTLTIDAVQPPGAVRYANGRTEADKHVLSFEQTPKQWTVPTTQFRLLKLMLGRDTSKWTGQTVTLHPAFGKTPQGEGPFIRITPPESLPESRIPLGIRQWFGKDLTGQDINSAASK